MLKYTIKNFLEYYTKNQNKTSLEIDNWNYQENTQSLDFSSLESKFDIKIHNDLKEYYQSYFFEYIEGIEYNGIGLSLDRILPNNNILSYIENELNASTDFPIFQIGVQGGTDLPIFFENNTGKLYTYEYPPYMERLDLVANSLEELFTNAKVWLQKEANLL